MVAFRGYLISGRRRGGAVFVRIAQAVKERFDPLGLLRGMFRVSMGINISLLILLVNKHAYIIF
ncbi:hypothetical protein, partial [Pseudomonas viridiflava]|uniref:hypothetical protein n=1 Tax=Pseudomonas viridiflava TaxID=33069 RepID=UPI0019D0DA91